MNPATSPTYRTARALFPHDPASWKREFIVEPLPLPMDHPELPLFPSDREVEAEALGTLEAELEPELLAAPEPPVFTDPIPARMLNEFVYCQRLFYYEFVDGVFVENADTERGAAIHEKVDRGKGDLPAAKKSRKKAAASPSLFDEDTAPAEAAPEVLPRAAVVLEDVDEVADDPADLSSSFGQNATHHAASAQPSADLSSSFGQNQELSPSALNEQPSTSPSDTIHSRSASMGSDRLGVVAKMDLIEVKVAARDPNDLFASREVLGVTPVDYKAGAPRRGEDANEIWDADKMQLGLQILVLRDNGYTCNEGVIYYRATKQRVSLPMTSELETWIMGRIVAARLVAGRGIIPPPLVNSPKCVRCSLAPVCLPDETRMLQRTALSVNRFPLSETSNESPSTAQPSPTGNGKRETENEIPIRRLIAARDEERALYLNTPGFRVGLKSEVLVVKDGDRLVDEIRLMDVSHVALFGNIQITTQALHELCEQEIPVAYFSMGGWFYGLTRGHGLKNVFTRIEQFRCAGDAERCLALARRVVQGKIKNQRTLLMRLHVDAPAAAVQQMKEQIARVMCARNLEELLGMEGAAAAVYFQHFAGMIKVQSDDDEIPGLESPGSKKEENEFKFDFTKRTRRPPTDPVNALLSLAYSLLAKDCTIAALAVGFDPYVGFYHQPRHGRPALALDLMEEFRPLIAESAVLTAINNRMITPGHFVRAGDAINLSPAGRKVFFQAYEQRMNALITHPIFDYKVSYRRVLELQARLLASHLTGEIPDYVPMVTR